MVNDVVEIVETLDLGESKEYQHQANESFPTGYSVTPEPPPPVASNKPVVLGYMVLTGISATNLLEGDMNNPTKTPSGGCSGGKPLPPCVVEVKYKEKLMREDKDREAFEKELKANKTPTQQDQVGPLDETGNWRLDGMEPGLPPPMGKDARAVWKWSQPLRLPYYSSRQVMEIHFYKKGSSTSGKKHLDSLTVPASTLKTRVEFPDEPEIRSQELIGVLDGMCHYEIRYELKK